MNMVSFVVTIGELLRMTGTQAYFDPKSANYMIPKYQREYKWSDERVLALIEDIKNRDKFLGNIILNKAEDYYELVDGQQRITTLILVLIAVFNRNKHPSKNERTEEQKSILDYLMRKEKFILENESIGTYIVIEETQIIIQINEQEDIYFQKETFDHLYQVIYKELSKIDNSELHRFQNKLLDCQVLVLISEPDGKQQDSIEEVFLDINFKSQLLDVANIFKGYCFKKYDAAKHDELKALWTSIRSYTKQFEKQFGYEENRETCEYLYLYLLSVPESYRIPANLSPGGIHYLEKKNHTQTKELLVDMVDYGAHVVGFSNNLAKTNYCFDDICFDAAAHNNDTKRIESLRAMALTIIQSKEAQYYKLPFFMLIHFLLKEKSLRNMLDFSLLKALVANMYIYAFLFINSGKTKNKSLIAYNILDQIHNTNRLPLKAVLVELKKVRLAFLENFEMFRSFNAAKGYAIYSIMDYYISNDNFIEHIYSVKNGDTLEHFVIHDNKSMEVKWKNGACDFSFSLRDLLGKPDGKNYKATIYKKQTINYLILPKELNELIEHDDIISKISMIKNYYTTRTTPIHIA